jgi:hypothetical protein
MTIVVGTVVSQNALGQAVLRTDIGQDERRVGERLLIEIDDGTRMMLTPADDLRVATTTQIQTAWAEAAQTPLGQMFADLPLTADARVQLDGWWLGPGMRLAVSGELDGNQLVAHRLAVVVGIDDNAAIAKIEPVRAREPHRAVAREPGERHIEMTWRCSTCQNKNLGRYKNCQNCSKPKDATERYEMPDDPASAVSVTDEALLQMATAGPDWRCAYCSSDQRASSGACMTCGASSTAGAEVPDDPAPPEPPQRRARWPYYVAGGLAIVGLAIGLLIWNAWRPRDYDGAVTAASWEHVIVVEHYANHDHEGFKETIPPGATNVTSVGQKVHHHEQVLDHYDTEHYTVEVPDGYRSETYTEQVACGQTCTERPKTCTEQCTPKKNGFASCRQVCTGGGQSCTTKYCSQTRTRQVPKTRTDFRTREVPKYRSEPRYAEAFKYKAWDWATDRTVKSTGVDTTGLGWPANGARTSALPDGEHERETRSASYTVTMTFHGDEIVRFAPKTQDEFTKFAVNSTHQIHRERDALSIDGTPITPLVNAEKP